MGYIIQNLYNSVTSYLFELYKAEILYFLLGYYIILVLLFGMILIQWYRKKEALPLRVIGYYFFAWYLILFICFSNEYTLYEKEAGPSVQWSGLEKIYQKIITDSNDVDFKVSRDHGTYLIWIYGAKENIVNDFQDIVTVTDRFIDFERYAMKDERILICFVKDDYYPNAHISVEIAALQNYYLHNDTLLVGKKRWIIYFTIRNDIGNFEQLKNQYSFSAGVDNVRIKDPSDYRIMEEWDGLQYFSGRIYGSEEKAYEIEAFLKEKFPDAIISVKAYN